MADAVAAVAGDLGMGDVRSLGVLAASWPELVGEGVAAHARPRSLRHGVLTIAVDSGAVVKVIAFGTAAKAGTNKPSNVVTTRMAMASVKLG